LLFDLNGGYLYEALDLKVRASPVEIIDRITDLMEEFQSKKGLVLKKDEVLINEVIKKLNLAQDILTERKAVYALACSMRDRIKEELRPDYGPFAEDYLNENIWKFAIGLDYENLKRPKAKLQEFMREAQRLVLQLPPLDLPKREIRNGQLQCTLTYKNPSCPKCGGKGRISNPKIEPIKQKIRELEPQKRIPFSNLINDESILKEYGTEKEIPCPECVKELMFLIPKGVKKGWVLENQEQEDGKMYFLQVNEISR